MTDNRTFLRVLFDAAVAAASPAACMPLWLEDRPAGNVIVVGAGKAAASMAAIIEQQWAEPLRGTGIKPIAIRSRSSKHPTRFPTNGA
jgi:hydroxypyruvate reductase